MATSLAKALGSDMSVRHIAEILRRKGRNRDTILAHITPREAKILKAHGGSGTINPNTGLPEFDDTGWFDTIGSSISNFFSPSTADAATFNAPAPATDVGATAPATVDQAPAKFDLQAGPAAIDQTSPYGGMPNTTYAANAPYFDLPTSVSTDAPLPPSRPADAQFAAYNTVAAPQVTPAPQTSSPDVNQIGDATQASGPPKDLTGAQAPQQQKPLGLDLSKINPLQAALALGGLGVGAYGLINAKQQAANQTAAINNIANQQAQLAQPLLTQGGQLYGQAVQGALTPANRQGFDAARAQLAQAAASTGGVGAMQATALAENMRQQALQSQLTQGLQLLGQGDSLMNSALSTQLQAITSQGQYATAAANTAMNFFGALGKIFGSTS